MTTDERARHLWLVHSTDWFRPDDADDSDRHTPTELQESQNRHPSAASAVDHG
jgi:hypothetical protein